MQVISSKVTTAEDFIEDKKFLTGDEKYKIIGKSLTERQLKKIIKECAGLKKNWDCLSKAKIAKKILKKGRVMVGSLMVNSSDMKSQYGFYYNPPYEFHAWLQLDKGKVIDIALPGVIDNGLNLSDDEGPFLTGRKPVVLGGKPLDWMLYNGFEYID